MDYWLKLALLGGGVIVIGSGVLLHEWSNKRRAKRLLAQTNGSKMPLKPDELVDAFVEAGRLAGVHLERSEIRPEVLPAPHRRPSSLPAGTQAIYAFLLGDTCLKVGKAGPKTQARFTGQHYGDNAPSTLAKSIIRDRGPILRLVPQRARGEVEVLTIASLGRWLEQNTWRFHIFLPAAAPSCALALAEAFTQCRLRPVYEGKGS